jgi:hypothetical protein
MWRLWVIFAPQKKAIVFVALAIFVVTRMQKENHWFQQVAKIFKKFLIFILSYLVFSQIWLNLLVDHLFRYNTKLGGKKYPE